MNQEYFDYLKHSFEDARKNGLKADDHAELEKFFSDFLAEQKAAYPNDFQFMESEFRSAIGRLRIWLSTEKREQADRAKLGRIRRSGQLIGQRIQSTSEQYNRWRIFLLKSVALISIPATIIVFGLVGYWFFTSNEAKLPQVQRAALENTACRPMSKEQCDFLIVALERTKSSFAITAANAGDLKPAEEIIRSRANEIRNDPNASAEAKRQSTADAAILGLAMSKIQEQLEQSNTKLGEVVKNTKNLKQETSNDPRKELANLGKNWNESDFLQTMVTCDLRALKLYKQAGMKLPRYKALEVLTLSKNVTCLNEYKDDFAEIGPEICFSSKYIGIAFRDLAPVHWLDSSFKVPEHRKFIEELCGEARLRSTYPKLYGEESRTVPPIARETKNEAPLVLFPDAPSTSAATATPATPAPVPSRTVATERALPPSYIRARIVSRTIQRGRLVYMYDPNGQLKFTMDGTNILKGSYHIEANGGVCWNVTQLGGRFCFEYYQRAGALRVRWANANNRSDIGPVTVMPQTNPSAPLSPRH
jgi:hypothetical protein